ncbi:MAG: hypothetical protein EXS36_12400 [Pedosphaera sp.]|nr:hypothetical protein [Pedosphaera sp.]
MSRLNGRRIFRWCWRSGVFVLLALMLAGGPFLYVNQVGIPDFVKAPILAQLRDRGVELEFGRMRFRIGRGIVAEQVNLGRAGQRVAEKFYADQVLLKFNNGSLLRFRPEVESLRLSAGRLVYPLGFTNEGPVKIVIEDLQAALRLIDSNNWVLDHLSGRVLGAEFSASGTVTNVSEWRRRKTPASIAWERVVHQIATRLESMEFTGAPKFNLDFLVDVREPERSSADVRLTASGAKSSVGSFNQLDWNVRLNRPMGTNGLIWVETRLEAEGARAVSGELTGLSLSASWQQPPSNQPPRQIIWTLGVRELDSRWGSVGNLQAAGQSYATNAVGPENVRERQPTWTQFSATASDVTSRWASAASPKISASAWHSWTNWERVDFVIDALQTAGAFNQHGASQPVAVDSLRLTGSAAPRLPTGQSTNDWGPWAIMAPYALAAELAVTNAQISEIELKSGRIAVNWSAPEVCVREFELMTTAGHLGGSARLGVDSREATAHLDSWADPGVVLPFLTTNASRWLRQFGWATNQAPEIHADGRIHLPAWTNRTPDWRGEVQPTVRLSGDFRGKNITFRGLPADRGQGRFTYANRIWHLPSVLVERPEGRLEFGYTGDDQSQNYHFSGVSSLDLRIVRSLLEQETHRRAMDEVGLPLPPTVQGDVWGHWRSPERTSFRVQIAVTNVSWRQEVADSLSAEITYTNRQVRFRDVVIRQAPGEVRADGGMFDLERQLVGITNAVSTVLPEHVTRVIGPKVAQWLAPYVFRKPPRVVMNGVLPTRGKIGANARWDISAEDFQWWKFRSPAIRTTLVTKDSLIQLTNFQAEFYGGRLEGELHFDVSPPEGTAIGFALSVTNADLKPLMLDLLPKTNRLEGRVTAVVNVDSANSWETNSWQGHGWMQLRDGFLWDFPLFGVFSPLLNGLSPGSGQSRFSEGQGHFVFTNSILRSDDLELRSLAARLHYSGIVRLDTTLDAHMEADLLKDAPLVGPVLNLAIAPFTKLFGYRVTGKLAKPETEPIYIPRLLLVPLHPFRSLKNLFSTEATPP